jgi:hypothetical protein
MNSNFQLPIRPLNLTGNLESRVAALMTNNTIELWLWYGVPVALVVLAFLSVIALVLLSSHPSTGSTKSSQPLPPSSHAYLVSQDQYSRPYLITQRTCRIGRSRDNEMFINDSSISRKHAEIQRRRNGKYVLYDRHSTNGVLVNSKKISKHTLQEGDIVEIGDVKLKFTERPTRYQVLKSSRMTRDQDRISAT